MSIRELNILADRLRKEAKSRRSAGETELAKLLDDAADQIVVKI